MECVLENLEDTMRLGFCIGKVLSDLYNKNANALHNENTSQNANTLHNENTSQNGLHSNLHRKDVNALPRVIYLYGDLGAGKTTFTRAFVSAFAGAENADVASPSFTLCHEYPTTPEIYHADLYRLPHDSNLPEELQELPDNTILIIEWAERLNKKEREENRIEIHFHVEQDKNIDKIPIEKLDNFENSCEKKRRVCLKLYGEETISSIINSSMENQNAESPSIEHSNMENSELENSELECLKQNLQNCFESIK